MNRVIERIINLLAFLLTAGRPVTAEEIRNTVAGYDRDSDDAFHRMFERDKDLIRRLGIPLELRPTDVWEVEHGYVVEAAHYQLPDPGLTEEERAALWLAAQAVRLGGQVSAPEAMYKLGGMPALTDGVPVAADLGADLDRLVTAFTAVSERRAVRFTYKDRLRTLHPFGIVHRRGHWYMVGAVPGGEGSRAFRLDRAGDLEPGDPGAFERPAGFRAADALPGAPWEAGADDVDAVVAFDREMAWWARRQLPASASVEEQGDGSLKVMMRVANRDAFVGWVLGFEDHAEVLEPPALREAVVKQVRGVA